MRKSVLAVSLLAAIAIVPSTTLAAKGSPQRGSDLPPGLLKAFEKMTPGIARAIIATEGSNSRLQDLPVSP